MSLACERGRAVDALGREVLGRAVDALGAAEVGAREAEVEQLDEPALRRACGTRKMFSVLMSPWRICAAVDEAHRVGDLPHDVARDLRRQPAAAACSFCVDGLAVEQLHHHEQAERVVLTEVDDRADVVVRERRGEPRLAVEHLADLRVRRDRALDELERERLAERLVADAQHAAHAAAAELALDDVAAADQVAGARAARARRAVGAGRAGLGARQAELGGDVARP